MEQTLQPGKTHLQHRLDLDTLLIPCEMDAAAAKLMAEDLLDFFDTMSRPTWANAPIPAPYLEEAMIRANILHHCTYRALTQVKGIYKQNSDLIEALRNNGTAAST